MQSVVAMGQPASPAAEVDIVGQEIRLTGRINTAAVEQVRALLASDVGRRLDTLAIDSTAGDVDAAMALGAVVRERGLVVRTQRVCAAVCSSHVAVASRRLVVPEGAFFLLSLMPSPQANNLIAARSRDPSLPEGERQRLRQTLDSVAMQLPAQENYYRLLGVEPAHVYSSVDLVLHVASQLRDRGIAPNAIAIFPDADYLRGCFGIGQVDMPTFTTEDSRRLAHAGRTPLAFLIDGTPHYEGQGLSAISLACRQ